MNSELESALINYVFDPENAEKNWDIAVIYDSIGQTAAAVGFYLRTVERTDNKLLQYEALMKAAICFMKQGTRGLSVRGLLSAAITVLPLRPEAHFLMARWWEREKNPVPEGWVNCYTQASMALQICQFDNLPPLRTDVEYPGKYGLIFEKAVSGWWVGRCEEAKDNFVDLYNNHVLDYPHMTSVVNNLKFLKVLK